MEEQTPFTSSLQELLITFWVFLRVLFSFPIFPNAEFGIFQPSLKKKQPNKQSNVLYGPSSFYFCRILIQSQRPRYLLTHPAGSLPLLWLLNPPWCLHVLGGMEDRAQPVPPSPGLKAPRYHFVWLIQGMLPLGTACRAQTSEAELPITLKSLGTLSRSQLIMPQPQNH